MFGRIFEELEVFDVTFEIYIEDKVINRQSMQAPKQFLIMNFLKTAEQIGNDGRPMKIKMIRPETIWCELKQEEKTLMNEISFNNNAMIAWEKDNQNDKNNE